MMPIQRKFVFGFGSKGIRSTLEVPVNIPLEQTVRDLVGRLVRAHNIPCYVEDGRSKFLALLLEPFGKPCTEWFATE